MPMEILLLILLGGMLVFMFVSSRKRTAKMREQEAIRQQRMVPGARVMTRSGLFGTLVAFDAEDLTKPALVEIAPGVVVEAHSQAIDLAPETEELAPVDDVADEAQHDVIDEPVIADDRIVADDAPVADDPRARTSLDGPDDKPKA